MLASPGRAVARDALASPGRRANAWTGRAEARDALASPEGRANAGGGAVFTWEGTVPSLGGYLPEKEGWPGKE